MIPTQDFPQDPSRPQHDPKEGLMDAHQIVAGLGGADNILEIEPCTTRLRAEVRDPSLVDEAALKRAGAVGVVRRGDALQVVVGPQADTIASDIEDLLG